MPFTPNQKSLRTHKLPDWYTDAKLGVIMLWGLYSIPAFAPTGKTSLRL